MWRGTNSPSAPRCFHWYPQRTTCGRGFSCCRSPTTVSLPHYSHEHLYAYESCLEIPAWNHFPPSSVFGVWDSKNGLRIDEEKVSTLRDLSGSGIEEDFLASKGQDRRNSCINRWLIGLLLICSFIGLSKRWKISQLQNTLFKECKTLSQGLMYKHETICLNT